MLRWRPFLPVLAIGGGCAAPVSPGSVRGASIIGEDGRTNGAPTELFREVGRAVAIFGKDATSLTEGEGGLATLWGARLLSEQIAHHNLCEGTRFADRMTWPRGDCTVFLVASDLVATAAHCVGPAVGAASPMDGWRIVFGFGDEPEQDLTHVRYADVYGVVETVAERNVAGEIDFAVLRLDRHVPDRTPLKIRRAGMVDDAARLGWVGHPHSLAMLYEPDIAVFDNDPSRGVFQFSGDIFGGNSGSPLFDADTGLVEGIISWGIGETSLVRDPDRDCYHWPLATVEESAQGSRAMRAWAIARHLP